MAWEVFRERNGCGTFHELQQMILAYRSDKQNTNPRIGCIVLTNPVFFQPTDWLDVPEDWSKSIVQGKSYDTTSGIGLQLWNQVAQLLKKYLPSDVYAGEKSQLILEEPTSLYGNAILRKVRLGQGAFQSW